MLHSKVPKPIDAMYIDIHIPFILDISIFVQGQAYTFPFTSKNCNLEVIPPLT